MHNPPATNCKLTSAKNYFVRVEGLRQSGCAPSEPSATPRWRLTPRLASMPRVALHIALPSQFNRFFSLFRSPILKEHSDVEGQLCPYVRMGSLGTRLHQDCNAMGDTAKTSPRVPSTCAQNAILSLYTSFQVARSMWLLTIHCSFRLSPVLLLVAISGITCAQLTMFPTLKTCKATAAGAFLTCTNFETGSKLPEIPGILVSARANQYSTKAPSSFRSMILNSRCSCHGRLPISAP